MTISLWVYKENGTLQCRDKIKGISLDDMKKQLGSIVGLSNILEEEGRTLPILIPAVCGAPTGQVNAYKLNEVGFHLLFRGFVGPMGFKPWIWAESDSDLRALAGDGDPFPVCNLMATANIEESAAAFINIMSVATAAGMQPNSVVELLGYKSRYYKEGDMISRDYFPDRVNIEVNDKSTILRIWFG